MFDRHSFVRLHVLLATFLPGALTVAPVASGAAPEELGVRQAELPLNNQVVAFPGG
jgi:hypothetical protein